MSDARRTVASCEELGRASGEGADYGSINCRTREAYRLGRHATLWWNSGFCAAFDVTAARINPLTHGPIARALFFFTLPILASNVLQSLNGSVNAVWVGHYLGEAALTATSNANTILFFLIALVFGVGMASAILIGQSVGARNLEQAKRVVGNGAAFFVVGSIAIASTGAIFTAPLLTFMQTPDDAMPFAIAYLRIIFAGIPFLFL